jgi:DNA processing protein
MTVTDGRGGVVPGRRPNGADDELLARVAWSSLAEPGDVVAGAVVAALGAGEALGWLREAVARGDAGPPAALAVPAWRGASEAASAAGDRRGGGAGPDGGGAGADGPGVDGRGASGPGVDGHGASRPGVDGRVAGELAVDGPGAGGSGLDGPASRARLARAVQRWAPRLDGCDPAADLEALDGLGARVVVPGDPDWPAGLEDLGPEAPLCLWVRGRTDVAAAAAGSVALVGARAATTYGERVAYDLAAGLAGHGRCVVSGGAYGIDAAAHRGAIFAGGPTIVVLAGGIDRTYPVGNARLFDAALEAAGAVISELGPGRLPTRSRFLQRNRLIAALGGATVVVEAAWRSGALSTAHHAARLLRPVAAVPGPVTSVASAGCHRLLREGVATCVTDVDDVLELVGPLTPRPGPAAPDVRDRPEDRLDPVARLVRDALPRRGAHDVTRLAADAGVSVQDVRASLGLLELAELAERTEGGWRVAR